MGKIAQVEPIRSIMVPLIEGCCGDPASRHYLCQYHSGYQDALEDHLPEGES